MHASAESITIASSKWLTQNRAQATSRNNVALLSIGYSGINSTVKTSSLQLVVQASTAIYAESNIYILLKKSISIQSFSNGISSHLSLHKGPIWLWRSVWCKSTQCQSDKNSARNQNKTWSVGYVSRYTRLVIKQLHIILYHISH